MIKFLNFPVRPKYLRGESLAGYVYRIHSENGHSMSQSSVRLMRKILSIDGRYMSLQDRVTIQDALGPDCPFNITEYLRDQFPFLEVRTTNAQRDQLSFCPSCIHSHQVHLGLWEQALISACAVHGIQLVNRCDQCLRTLKWPDLRPGWHCLCGRLLTAMGTVKANAVECSLSGLISLASDQQIPRSYPLFISESKMDMTSSFTLRTIYNLIFRFHDLRKTLVDFLFLGRNPTVIGPWRSTRARLSPHRWEHALLSKWPMGLQNSLLKLAKRALRSNSSTFIATHKNIYFHYVILQLNHSDLRSGPGGPLYRAVWQLLNQFRPPFESDCLILSNPTLTAEHLGARIAVLRDWWHLHCNGIRSNDVKESSPAVWLGFPQDQVTKEELAVDSLNALIELANKGASFPECDCSWYKDYVFGDIFSGHELSSFLVALWKKLMGLRLAQLQELVLRAGKICRGESP